MAITITDLEFYLVEIGCVGQEPPVRSLLVRLASNTGLEGWGETQTDWRASELSARRNALLPILAGRSIFEIEDLHALSALRWAPLRCAVEMASWDLIGRAARQPLCHLLGGGYRQRVPVAIRLSGTARSQCASQARELDEQGFHAQILSSCGSLERDLELVAEVSEVLPQRAELWFDAAGGYSMEDARDLCSALEGLGLHCIVDPLAARDLDRTAALRRQTSIPLTVSQALRSPADVLAVVRCGAAPGVIVDLHLVGGLVPARSAQRLPRPPASVPRWPTDRRSASASPPCCSLPRQLQPIQAATSAPTTNSRTTCSSSPSKSPMG